LGQKKKRKQDDVDRKGAIGTWWGPEKRQRKGKVGKSNPEKRVLFPVPAFRNKLNPRTQIQKKPGGAAKEGKDGQEKQLGCKGTNPSDKGGDTWRPCHQIGRGDHPEHKARLGF